MPFKIGDEVVFLHEVGGGVVRNIKGNIFYVEDDSGFERPFEAKFLGRKHYVKAKVNHKFDEIIAQKEGLSKKKPSTKVIRKHADFWEIDLHFEEIAPSNAGLTNTEILYKQLAVFKRFYHEAREKKMRRIVIIHGVGKGVLREEIRVFLQGQGGAVEFLDGSYSNYGFGATQVELRYKY